MKLLFILLFLVSLHFAGAIPSIQEQEARQNKTQQLLRRLHDDYDARVSPFQITGKKVDVEFVVIFQEFHSIDDDEMEYVTRVHLERKWKDERLAFGKFTDLNYDEDEIVIRHDVDRIWRPDIYFVGEREGRLHNISTNNEGIWISKDGTVSFRSRYSEVISCLLTLNDFPFDTQICYFDVGSATYTTTEIELAWRSENGVILPEELDLQSFDLLEYQPEFCTGERQPGDDPCLRVRFVLKRKYTYYLITTYTSSTFVVFVSYVAYWISPDAVAGRVNIGVTAVYNMITQLFLGGLSLPQVPYIKAVDLWLAICIIMVFYSLIEFSVLNILIRAENNTMLAEQAQKIQFDPESFEMSSSADLMERIGDYLADLNPRGHASIIYHIDLASRIGVPIFFMACAAGYGAYYGVI